MFKATFQLKGHNLRFSGIARSFSKAVEIALCSICDYYKVNEIDSNAVTVTVKSQGLQRGIIGKL